MRATARKNGVFGWKAVVVRDSGSTYQPVRHNFANRAEAVAYAVKWIEANRGPGSAK